MSATALILVLLGVIAMALHSITQKIALDRFGCSRKEVLVFQHLLAVPILLAALPIFYFGFGESLEPKSGAMFAFAIAGVTITNIFIQYANVRSRETADLSLTAPVSAMTPGLVAVAAIVLGEFPSTQGYIGIFLIMGGTYIHCLEQACGWKDFVKPLSMLRLPSDFEKRGKEDQVVLLKNRSALRWAYGSAIVGTGGLIFDGLTARNGSVSIGFAIQCTLLSGAFMTMPQEQKENGLGHGPEPFLKRLRVIRTPILLLGLFYGLHAVFVASAFRFAPVAYVGSLKRLSIVATVVLSFFILKEAKAKRRLWPALIITLGAILLALDGVLGRLIDVAQNSLN